MNNRTYVLFSNWNCSNPLSHETRVHDILSIIIIYTVYILRIKPQARANSITTAVYTYVMRT